jgi:hypothetical protein
MNICYPNDFQGFDDIKKVFRFMVEHSVEVITISNLYIKWNIYRTFLCLYWYRHCSYTSVLQNWQYVSSFWYCMLQGAETEECVTYCLWECNVFVVWWCWQLQFFENLFASCRDLKYVIVQPGLRESRRSLGQSQMWSSPPPPLQKSYKYMNIFHYIKWILMKDQE